MADLLDLMSTGETEGGGLEELKLGEDPVAILLFTRETEEVLLHYEKDETVNAYLICPGSACPSCQLSNRPKNFWLIPVLDVDAGTVKVLRIAARLGPSTLAGLLRPFLKDADATATLLLLSRVRSTYKLVARPLSKNADRCAGAVRAFQVAVKGGLKCSAAFLSMTSEEIAEIPRVRALLERLGDGSDASGCDRDDQAAP